MPIQFAKVDEALLAEIVGKIVQHFDPEKIIVFGSHAWGAPGEESDLDLFIIMESEERPAARATQVAHYCHPGNLSMDVLVRTPAEIAHRLAIGDFLVKKIVEEGRVIYDRRTGARVGGKGRE